ncbi:CAP domain-containing protein [Peribacillus asahii]|uniref:CAP domain-containing protein n=1 Tax=Peribacillus asahii TaxID=228899 RepID=UPI00207A882A|nr:CAP domain-containing protein [Peribacillus asahii]USK58370.1 CAP domain-containing protein [Peribacillus asahii]
MKKKLILSTVAAAAVMFSGAGFNQAEAAQVNCQPTKQFTYKVTSQQDAQKLVQQYFAKYGIKVQGNAIQAPTQQAQQPTQAKQQAPTQQQVQKPTTQQPTTNNNATADTNKPTATETNTSVSAFEKKVVELTNAERAKQGLAPLTLDTELSKVARAKSQDMKDKNYFDHNSPTYGSPFDMMKSFGISYKSAGENIAQGQTTPEQVVQAWMNSQGHRENIMNSSFTHIGVGYVASGNYWTQMFIGK